MDLAAKRAALDARLRGLGRLLVAYSGGVDSAFLAWAAREALGGEVASRPSPVAQVPPFPSLRSAKDGAPTENLKMLAVIADSPSLARTQLEDALAFAAEQQIPVEVIPTAELERAEYARNDAFRCFHCKDELFTVMEQLRQARGFDCVVYGVNADDAGDFRPGQEAARRHGVAAPLLDAGLGKQEIRELARQAGLRVWDKAASACLSSRIEYGRPVTREALAAIEQGEDALRALGFRQFRVRHHGAIVRVEIAPDEMPRALNPAMAAEFTRLFKALGFRYVTLDLEGFRSGSMNAVLPAEVLARRKDIG